MHWLPLSDIPVRPAWHPALINLAPLRRSLGVRTVFNLLGIWSTLTPDAQVLVSPRPNC